MSDGTSLLSASRWEPLTKTGITFRAHHRRRHGRHRPRHPPSATASSSSKTAICHRHVVRIDHDEVLLDIGSSPRRHPGARALHSQRRRPLRDRLDRRQDRMPVLQKEDKEDVSSLQEARPVREGVEQHRRLKNRDEVCEGVVIEVVKVDSSSTSVFADSCLPRSSNYDACANSSPISARPSSQDHRTRSQRNHRRSPPAPAAAAEDLHGSTVTTNGSASAGIRASAQSRGC